MKIVLFNSRNKDNKNIPNFKQRSKTFIFEDEETTMKKFVKFAEEGVPGETSRLYISVNERDEEKTRKQLICELVMDNVSLERINSKIYSIAMQPQNAEEKKWLFDFDENNEELVKKFAEDVRAFGKCQVWIKPTKNGFAIISEHGFDTRELLTKYKNYDITLKRDAMLYVKSYTKSKI